MPTAVRHRLHSDARTNTAVRHRLHSDARTKISPTWQTDYQEGEDQDEHLLLLNILALQKEDNHNQPNSSYIYIYFVLSQTYTKTKISVHECSITQMHQGLFIKRQIIFQKNSFLTSVIFESVFDISEGMCSRNISV